MKMTSWYALSTCLRMNSNGPGLHQPVEEPDHPWSQAAPVDLCAENCCLLGLCVDEDLTIATVNPPGVFLADSHVGWPASCSSRRLDGTACSETSPARQFSIGRCLPNPTGVGQPGAMPSGSATVTVAVSHRDGCISRRQQREGRQRCPSRCIVGSRHACEKRRGLRPRCPQLPGAF